MSGLEPLAALGLACNIVQLISSGREIIGIAKGVYQNGTLDYAVKSHADDLLRLANELEIKHLPALNRRHKLRAERLQKCAQRCSAAARSLHEEIVFIQSKAQTGSLTSAVKTTAIVSWRKRRLNRLEMELKDNEAYMNTAGLHYLCDQVDGIGEQIDSLDAVLREFIWNWKDGNRTTKELISIQARQIQDHTRDIVYQSETIMKRHVTREVGGSAIQMQKFVEQKLAAELSKIERERLLERLKQSLKFEGMNERVNDIKDSNVNTFKWILTEADHVGECENNIGASELNTLNRTLPISNDTDGVASGSTNVDEPFHFNGHHIHVEPNVDEPFHFNGRYTHVDPVWDRFDEWLKSDATIYWISGKPGSGKSTLVKYLCRNELTKSSLEVWRSNVIIISHFFWRPGTKMQKSIRGLMASLLYQLLAAQPPLLDVLSKTIEEVKYKSESTDWSLKDLRAGLVLAIRESARPICIFMDGADEMDGPDETMQNLMTLVDDCRAAHPGAVKICFSGRPEPSIQERLVRYPHLRLEDLTREDMKEYIRSHLNYRSTLSDMPWSHSFQVGIAHRLLHKAEGVFLWLYIVIRDLNKGIEDGDSEEELDQRLECLHSDLSQLYEDMWQRYNGNNADFRKEAALYFKLFIMIPKMDFPEFSLMHMLLASITIPSCHMDAIRQISTNEQVTLRCGKIERRVTLRCMGLIQVIESVLERPVKRRAKEEAQLLPPDSFGKAFRPIHRTVLDFLVDTEKGREILDNDTHSEVEIMIKILKACLYIVRIFRPIPAPGHRLEGNAFWGYDFYLGFVEQLGTCVIWSSTCPHSLEKLDSLRKIIWIEWESLLFEGKFQKSVSNMNAVWEGLRDGARRNSQHYILFNVSGRKLTRTSKSQLLIVVLGGKLRQMGAMFNSCQMLLKEGADPNMALPIDQREPGYYKLMTPIDELLQGVLFDKSDIPSLSSVLELCNLLEKFGADFEHQVCVRIYPYGVLAWHDYGKESDFSFYTTFRISSLVKALKSNSLIGLPEGRIRALTCHLERHKNSWKPGKQRVGYINTQLFKEVSEEDSDYVLEKLPLWYTRNQSRDELRGILDELEERIHEVYQRSAYGEGTYMKHLEKLGYYISEQTYEEKYKSLLNPWMLDVPTHLASLDT